VYFTYQVGAGGPERNSVDTPHAYTVGQSCTTVTANAPARQLPELTVFPTPSQDVATVTFTARAADAYQLEVFDLKGVLVQKAVRGTAAANQLVAHHLPVAAYASGVYLVKLQTAQGVVTRRLVVAR
jgi:hypothetical protein